MASAAAATASQIVVVLGAGPGLGEACCRTFAQRGHPVALLARSYDHLAALSSKINAELKDEHRTRPYAVDVTKRAEVERVFAAIKDDWRASDARIHTAIFNPGGLFKIKSFLDATEDDFRSSYDVQVIGGVFFAQAFIRALRETPSWDAWQKDPSITAPVGNLLVSGATAAMRGSARLATFATSSFGLRALSQSIAREFGPLGVHVSHFVIDGVIETPRVQEKFGVSTEAGTRMEPSAIAQVYYDTTLQQRSVWAFETDLRPAKEKW